MAATTGEFITIIRPLDRFVDHRLHPDAIDKAYAVYLDAGPEAAKKLVRLMATNFSDLKHDSYLTPEVTQ